MTECIEDSLFILDEIAKNTRYLKLAVIDRTKSILKARIIFTEDVFIQIYINIKKPKRSYTLIMNDARIFGKDYAWGIWHTHPFGSPEYHDDTEEGKKPVTIKEFFEQTVFILSEKLEII